MRKTILPNGIIHAVVIVLLLHAAQAAPVKAAAPIESTLGKDAFKQAIASENFSFVKFFNPGCPHCQAMAKDFEELSFKVSDHNHNAATPENHTIAIIQVDDSKPENGPVMAEHVSGFPTLKLFRGGKMIMEYFGARKAEPMYEFLMKTLQLAERPLITRLETAKQVTEFLELASERPVVISLFHLRSSSAYETDTTARDHFPKHIQLSTTEWDDTVQIMHEQTAPQTAFATVSYPDLLVPKSSAKRFKEISSRHSVPPLLVAASRADDFETSAEWYFPGVRDGAPPSSFMHTEIVDPEQFVTLDKHNKPHILETTRPVAIAFGKGDVPSYMEENFLFRAGRQETRPRMLPVFASIKHCQDLAEHVKLSVPREPMNETEIEEWESTYVIYRFGNQGPVSAIYSSEDGKTVKEWVHQQAENVNGTDIATHAGELLELDVTKWKNLLEFDGRGVVLEVYRSDCSSCRNLKHTSARVAAQLRPYAGMIVVARFDVSKYKLPEWPTLPNITSATEVIWVAPGEKPATYDGYRSARGIARFAMEMSGLQEDRIAWVDVIISHMLLWGVVSALAGIALMVRSRNRSQKREHVT